MNRLFSLLVTPAALICLALPAVAQAVTETGMDVADMTCGDVKALDGPQMEAISAEAMKMAAMTDDEIAEMKAMTEEERAKSKSDEAAETAAMTADQKATRDKMMDESMSALMAACGDDDSMMILDAAKKAGN